MNNRIYEFILSNYGYHSREYQSVNDDYEYGMSFAEWSENYDHHPNRPKDFVERYWSEASEAERAKIAHYAKCQARSIIAAAQEELESLEKEYPSPR